MKIHITVYDNDQLISQAIASTFERAYKELNTLEQDYLKTVAAK